MQAIETNNLFTEITTEESAIVSGGDTIKAGINLTQLAFAIGAGQLALNLTGSVALGQKVFLDLGARAFRSSFKFK